MSGGGGGDDSDDDGGDDDDDGDDDGDGDDDDSGHLGSPRVTSCHLCSLPRCTCCGAGSAGTMAASGLCASGTHLP